MDIDRAIAYEAKEIAAQGTDLAQRLAMPPEPEQGGLDHIMRGLPRMHDRIGEPREIPGMPFHDDRESGLVAVADPRDERGVIWHGGMLMRCRTIALHA